MRGNWIRLSFHILISATTTDSKSKCNEHKHHDTDTIIHTYTDKHTLVFCPYTFYFFVTSFLNVLDYSIFAHSRWTTYLPDKSWFRTNLIDFGVNLPKKIRFRKKLPKMLSLENLYQAVTLCLPWGFA